MARQPKTRKCPLYGICQYPGAHSRYFKPGKIPCLQEGFLFEDETPWIASYSFGQVCEIEVMLTDNVMSPRYAADQVERNVQSELPWNCGCELCQSGEWTRCYEKNGPNRELRNLLASNNQGYSWHEHQHYLAQQAEQAKKAAEANAPE
jgi:hypothetical protein